MKSLLGHYRILQRIGAGGAAVVYLAEDERNQQTVALKVLSPEARNQPLITEAFRREATVAGEHSHPNLVACIDSGVDDDPPWIAYELVKGTALPTITKRSGFLDPSWAVNIIIDVAYGLASLHQTGIIHRDVKPANILFASDGSIKLIDFGAALAADVTGVSSDNQATGWSGTLAYASPEQLQERNMNYSSDLYSLGLVFYEMLTGHRVIAATNRLEALASHGKIADELVVPSVRQPGLPQELDEIVMALLELFPNERKYRNTLSLIDDLEAMADKQGWISKEQRQGRIEARNELAESSYWFAKSQLNAGLLDEAINAYENLGKLLGSSSSPYLRSALDDLMSLMGEPDVDNEWASVGNETTEKLLSMVCRVAAFAHHQGNRLLCAVTAQRTKTLAKRMPDDRARLRVYRAYLVADPGSLLIGLACIEMATVLKKQSFANSLMKAMAVLASERGWIEGAMALAGKTNGGPMIQRVVEKCKRNKALRVTFQRVLEALRNRSCTDQAINVCSKFLGEDRGWEHTWLALADLHIDAEETEAAAAALLEAGIVSLERGNLEKARRYFGKCLEHSQRNASAWTGYHEASLALSCIPEAAKSSQVLRIRLLLADGLYKALGSDFEQYLRHEDTSEEDLHFLYEIMPLGRNPIKVRLDRRLGEWALYQGETKKAVDHFLEAIKGSSNPDSELRSILDLQGLRAHLSLIDIMKLRRATGIGIEATVPRRKSDSLPSVPNRINKVESAPSMNIC